MTVPGVYSPEQIQQEAWEQSQGLANRLMGSGKPDPEAYSIHGVDGGVWWVYKGGEPVLPYPTKAIAELAARGMINKAARPYDATIRAAAESDGVDDSRAVEVMARAMMNDEFAFYELGLPGRMPYDSRWPSLARAALGALRALEGE